MVKTCTKCGEEKPLDSGFYAQGRKDGTRRYFAVCKPCHNARCRKWSRANKDRVAANQGARLEAARYGAQSGHDVGPLANHMHAMKRHGAARVGLIYELTPEWYAKRLEHGMCEATGLSLTPEDVGGPCSPSVDQIVPGDGYSVANSRMVCYGWNMSRKAYDDATLLKMWGAWVDRQRAEEARE